MNSRITKTILLFLLLGAASMSSKAQIINFNYADGSNATYNLFDIRKITFEGDEMVMQLLDGSVYSWNVSSIRDFRFDGNPLSNEELLSKVNSWQVSVFPNPTSNLLNVHYNLPADDNILIGLFDLRGKLLLEIKVGNRLKGEQKECIDISTLSAGHYVCCISGQKNTISKNIIKQ